MSLNVSIVFEAVNKISGTVRGVTASVRAIAQANTDNAAAATRATQASDRQAASLRAIEGAAKSLSAAKAQLHDRMMKVAAMNLAGDQVQRFGRAVAAPLLEGVRTAATFEKSMSGVRAVTRANEADFASLTQAARDLGATTQFAASEAAEGMRFLGMAGLDTQQIMAAMPSMLDMALSSGIDLGTAADIGSNILSGFRLPAEEMRRVADVLALTAASSNVDIRMMGESMKYAAPIASQLGVSLEEVAAMAGFLGNVGIQGSMAGTAIRNMMSRLARTSGPVADKIAALGIEVTNLRGQLLPMPEVLSNVLEGTADLSDLERTGLFMEIFGERAGGAVAELAASGAGLDEFIDLLKGADGSAAQMAAVMSDNLHGATKALDSALESLRITVGNRLVAAIRWLTSGATALTRWFDGMAERSPVLTQGLVIVAGGLAAAALAGGLLIKTMAGVMGTMAVFKFAVASLGPVLTLFSLKWIPAAIGSLKLLGLAFFKIPVIGWIAAIVAAVGFLIYKFWTPLSAFMRGMALELSAALEPVREAIRGVTTALDPLWTALQPLRAWFAGLGGEAGAAEAWGRVVGAAISGLLRPLTLVARYISFLLEQMERLRNLGGSVGRFARKTLGVGAAGAAVAAGPALAAGPAFDASGDDYEPIQVGGSSVVIDSPITIHAAPGMDTTDLARQVQAAVSRAVQEGEREKTRRRRSRLHD